MRMDKLLGSRAKELYTYMAGNVGPGTGTLAGTSYHLYLGTKNHASDIDTLNDNKIGAVVSVMAVDLDAKILAVYKKKKIEHLYLPYRKDGDDFRPVFARGSDFIHENILAGKKVLVHCEEGINAGPTLLIWYYTQRIYESCYHVDKVKTARLLNMEDSLMIEMAKLVKGRRPCILPSPSLTLQLVQMELMIKNYFAQGLIDEAIELRDRIKEEEEVDPDISEIIESDQMTVPFALRLVFREEAGGEGAKEQAKEEEEFDRLDEIASLRGSL